jgi:hypothetical protein
MTTRLETPVAFLLFNRPETTARVFAEIARARPRRLLVVADGPRTPEEAPKCAAARAVIDRVDWDCEVLTNYSDVNLGCKRRVSSGLDWVFEQCEEAIVLEDDCMPHPTFFRYCAELLNYYRDDARVMMISGNNFQRGQKRGSGSYYFSCYTHIWGWASWRRAWQWYDVEMKRWPVLRDTPWLADWHGDRAAAGHWRLVLEKCFAGQMDTWDIQWMFSCWTRQGLAALPNINLVSNVGFGAEATHTKEDIYGVAELPAEPMAFPLKHPAAIEIRRDADRYTFERIFAREGEHPGQIARLRRKAWIAMPAPLRRFLSDFYFKSAA